MSYLSTLNISQLQDFEEIVKLWTIRIDEKGQEFKRKYLTFYKKIIVMMLNPLFKEITDTAPWLIEEDSMAAGAAAYIGIFIFRIIYKIPRSCDLDEKIDIAIIMIYLTADFFLDNKQTLQEDKNNLKRVLKEQPAEIPDYLHPHARVVYSNFLFLTNNNEYAKDALLYAWKEEVESEKQLDDTAAIKELWNISAEKGAATVIMTSKILTGKELPNCWILGAVTQWIDDLCDIKLDRVDGIHTAATKYIDIGEYDNYVYRIASEINRLDNSLWPLKSIFMTIICSVTKYSNDSSYELKNLIGHYSMFENKYNFDTFISKLFDSFE